MVVLSLTGKLMKKIEFPEMDRYLLDISKKQSRYQLVMGRAA
jgi:hypothetical protein